MKKHIYVDHAASTPIDKRVLEAMMPYLKEEYGNASSTHLFGQRARAAIERAREQVAQFLDCGADEVIFISGATEANNLVVQSVRKSGIGTPHIVTTAIEHESVLEPCRILEQEGVAEVTYVYPKKDGIVSVQDIQNAVRPSTVLVSVMHANSEIGTIQPVQEIGEYIQERKRKKKSPYPVFHIDAVQAANFLECNTQALCADFLTLSGHKIYGPKGIGVLYKKEKVFMKPMVLGGGQELGMRSGTENVAAIVGFGAAIREIENQKGKNEKIRELRDGLIQRVLADIPQSKLTGSTEKRLSHNAHFRFPGIRGRDVVILLDQKGIAAATGSACSEKQQSASHVLLALGLSAKDALSAVRITLGRYTTKREVEYIGKNLRQAVAQLRKERI